eukprot:Skav200185  [mRNA]  locus=scaffold2383:93306:103250:+ [translate_table: standard]
MAIRLATICSLLLGVRTCSVTGDWKQTSAVTQRAAAQVVIQGVADGIFSCILDPALPDYDADSPKTSYHAKDEERLKLEFSLFVLAYQFQVLVRNITVLKGSISCDEVLVGGSLVQRDRIGFSSSAACGTDPPSFGVSGTYFLCGVETNGCKATLNTNGCSDVSACASFVRHAFFGTPPEALSREAVHEWLRSHLGAASDDALTALEATLGRFGHRRGAPSNCFVFGQGSVEAWYKPLLFRTLMEAQRFLARCRLKRQGFKETRDPKIRDLCYLERCDGDADEPPLLVLHGYGRGA